MRAIRSVMRVLGSFKEESWEYDYDSTQLAVGVRYKPFRTINFFTSFERLIEIGDNSENNWLLRGLISENWGRDPKFGSKYWHSGTVYADYGIFLESTKNSFNETNDRQVFYVELKDGVLFQLHPNWGIIPHLIADYHWDSTDNALGTYIEGGLGIELLGWLHETDYKAHDWRLSISVQYKWGSFEDTPVGEEGKSYQGFVVQTNIIY